MDRKLDMKDMETKIHREGAQGGQHRSHRPLSISIVSLNGELIHAQRETERGWEKRGKKIQRKIIADLHLLLKSHLLSD